MTVEERLAAQAAKQVSLTPRTDFGAQVLRQTNRPADQTPLQPPWAQDMLTNLRAKHAAEAEELRRNATFDSPEQAKRAAEILKQHAEDWEPERLKAGWDRVKRYVAENPEAVEQFRKADAKAQWEKQYIDTTPVSSSLQKRKDLATAAALGMPPSLVEATGISIFPEGREPDPDSREGVLRSEEKQGLDTTSGFGTLGDVATGALKFNSPRARVAFLNAAVKDNLNAAGIELPEGLEPIAINENLGELMYLRPTKDGKVKWTLAEGEFWRPEDLGGAVDLPDLLSAVGAGAAAFVPFKHPAIAEFLGDYAGRNLGIMLEYLINKGEVTPEEYQDLITGAPLQSLTDTVVGRTIGRVGESIKNRTRYRGAEDPDVLAANVQETADVMTRINELSGGEQAISRAEATNSTQELQLQGGREKTLPKAAAEELEEIRIQNVRNLAVANEQVARNAQSGASMNYNPQATVQEGVAAVNKHRTEFGKIQTSSNQTADDGYINYWYGGDTAGKLDGETLDSGITVLFDYDKNVATLHLAVGGGTFRGGLAPLVERALEDVPDGMALASGDSVSASAQSYIKKMEAAGWGFRINNKAARAANGNLSTPDGSPVFYVTHVPGEVVASRDIAKAKFDRTVLDEELEKMAEVLPAAQRFLAQTNNRLKATIKWSDQRQTSGYSVENKSSNTLRQQVRRLQNRVENALTGVEAKETDKQLAMILRQEVDEEGNDVIGGLASDELDLGNLINARAKLKEIAGDTGDEEIARVVETIDNVLKNGTIWTQKGNPIADSTRANILQSMELVRLAQGHVDRAQASLNASALFKRNHVGEFVNTNLQQVSGIMANDARFIRHMKPILDENPAIKDSARDALYELYQKDVLEGGWTRRKHNTWIDRYGRSAEYVLGEEGYDNILRMQLQEGGEGLWTRMLGRAKNNLSRIAARTDLTPVNLNAKNIIGSFTKMGPDRARSVMRDIERLDPALAERVRWHSAEQIRQDLNDRFFDVDNVGVDRLGTARSLSKWFKENRDTLAAVHGEQYASDMGNIVRAHQIDARRTRVKGYRPETQGDVIRVTRSLLGPLSRPQRMITAATSTRQRLLARKVLDVYSDPEKLRTLQQAKGLSPRSRAGIAVLSRLGIFEAVGISEEDKDFMPKVMEFYNWIDEMSEQGLVDNAE